MNDDYLWMIRCDWCATRFTKQAYGWDQWVLAQRYGWHEMGSHNESIACPTCYETVPHSKFA